MKLACGVRMGFEAECAGVELKLLWWCERFLSIAVLHINGDMQSRFFVADTKVTAGFCFFAGGVLDV